MDLTDYSSSDFFDESERRAIAEREADAESLNDREAAGYYDDAFDPFDNIREGIRRIREQYGSGGSRPLYLDNDSMCPDICPDCQGTGEDPEAPPNPCPTCGDGGPDSGYHFDTR